MRDNATEIKKVLKEHQYSIHAIIFDVMQTFKLHSIVRHTQFEKPEGVEWDVNARASKCSQHHRRRKTLWCRGAQLK